MRPSDRQITYPVDFPHLLCFGWQRPGEQSKGEGTDKPDGPEPHNGLLYCYEGTNITGGKVVNHYRTQLNDALIESYGRLRALHDKGRPVVDRSLLAHLWTRSSTIP